METALNSVECPEPVEGHCFVYILLCTNGTLYIGQSADVASRLETHRKGAGAEHTKKHVPVSLVYFEGPLTLEEAAGRERQIKRWSRAKKIALIKGDFNALKELSKSR